MAQLDAVEVKAVHMVDLRWTDPDSGKVWLYFNSDGMYASFKAMPMVLLCDGILFRKMGYNSDTGRVGYKQANREDVALEE
jgi:hypothetical protein